MDTLVTKHLLSHSLQPRPQSLQGHSTATSCTPLRCGHGHPCHQTPPPGNPKRRSPPAHFMWEGAQLTTTHGPLDTCTATATATTTYRWLSCEPGHAIHEASQLDDALHFVQISEFGFQRRQQIDGNDFRGLCGVFRGGVLADTPTFHAAVRKRQVPGRKHQVSC